MCQSNVFANPLCKVKMYSFEGMYAQIQAIERGGQNERPENNELK